MLLQSAECWDATAIDRVLECHCNRYSAGILLQSVECWNATAILTSILKIMQAECNFPALPLFILYTFSHSILEHLRNTGGYAGTL